MLLKWNVTVFFVLCLVAGIVAFSDSTSVVAEDTGAPVSRVQALIESSLREWHADDADLMNCLKQCSENGWSLRCDGRKSHHFEITIDREGKPAYSWKGHFKSVFAIKNDVLVYVDFYPIRPGARVVCVDLKTSAKKWSCDVGLVLGVLPHSNYASEYAIHVVDNYVLVDGNESHGRFASIMDVTTGRLLEERKAKN